LSNKPDSQSEVTVWVLASSPIWSAHATIGWLPKPDHVVAADGGSTLAARLGLTPNLIIGDLDSADPALIAQWEEAGVEVRRYEHTQKLETDTELAVLEALGWQPARIYLLGATGGRLDHEIANILLLTHPRLVLIDLRVIDGRQELFLAKPGRWNDLRGEPGDTVSLLPLGGDAEGVETEGLEYPLHRETLLHGRGRGVSNRLLAPNARVWLEKGLMLVVHLHTGPQDGTEGEKV
jgi:thiamine pyrophosphokinase